MSRKIILQVRVTESNLIEEVYPLTTEIASVCTLYKILYSSLFIRFVIQPADCVDIFAPDPPPIEIGSRLDSPTDTVESSSPYI